MALETSKRNSADGDALCQQLDDAIVKEALSSGLDLRTYSKQVEEQLKKVQHEAVKAYVKEAGNIATLHQEISGCDEILQRMEEMLSKFQCDLGTISSEIQTLQEQSVVMNMKLKNRQGLRGELCQFVGEMAVQPEMIKSILEVPVTEREFLEQLHELQHKISFVKEQSFREARSCKDVDGLLEELKYKAIEKIREFLLAKIGQFRKPLTNYQVTQNSLLKLRFFYEFLLSNKREVAKEITDDYVDTMSKVFYSYFKTLAGRLMKLQAEDGPGKDDVLGAEDMARAPSLFSSKPSVRSRATVFTLGARAQVLNDELEADCIVPHMAEQGNEKFHFESLFRSFLYALVDNGCREFLFLNDFFMATGKALLDLFNAVMGKSLGIITKTVENYTTSSYDSIGLLLCIHIIYRYQALTRKRNVSALDQYFDSLLQMLWPRFMTVMKMNIDSVRVVDAIKISSDDTRPHYIVRRYAEFASALVTINSTMPDQRLQQQLNQLEAEIESLLVRLSSLLKDKKQQLICLINNYDLILSILSERVSEDTLEVQTFKELLQTNSSIYIEVILVSRFDAMMNFVKECEALIEQGHSDLLKRYSDKATKIVRSFNVEWRRSTETIKQEIMISFNDLRNGSNILQNALTQLIQYYHRFNKVLSHAAFASCAGKNELVNMHTIMVEVKKYKTVY